MHTCEHVHVRGAWNGTSVTRVSSFGAACWTHAHGPPLPCFSISASLLHSTLLFQTCHPNPSRVKEPTEMAGNCLKQTCSPDLEQEATLGA